MNDNIIFIGMPGCGKSTIGSLLAKAMGWKFLDTDYLSMEREGARLQDIITDCGLAIFREAENSALLSVDARRTVIATGGSAVFCTEGMTHLKSLGRVVYLRLPFEVIEGRVKNPATRGIALAPGKTLRDAYDERTPLYEEWADVIVDGKGDSRETLAAVIPALGLTVNPRKDRPRRNRRR